MPKSIERVVDRITAYAESYGIDGEPDTILWHLLVDAREYADAHGLDFGLIDREAYQGYVEAKD